MDHQPRYHFHPGAHWMNDPNGLIQWNGQYHLFYQHNPEQPYAAQIHWGHAVSDDLVHWVHLPVALAPTPGGPDANGCWSGCTVDDHGVPTIVYTGMRVQDDGRSRRETICLARSTDLEHLRTWEKDAGNPVIAAPPQGLDVIGFRDPYVWKEGEVWFLVVGSGIRGVGGTTLLYRSTDLRQWDYLHPLLTRPATDTDPLWTGPMWECPQFFPLGDSYVLIVSVWNRGEFRNPAFHEHVYPIYFVGSYTDATFVPEHVAILDLGADYYAPATMQDDQGRRLIWGWSAEGRSPAAQQAAGWAGVMALPRMLTLRADRTMGMEPAPELRMLRRQHRHWTDLALEDGSTQTLSDAQGACLEIMASFGAGDATQYGLQVRCSPQNEEHTLIYYDRARGQLCVDRSRSSLDPEAAGGVDGGPFVVPHGENLRLHVFLDHSIVEVYANAQACLTERVYPSRADSGAVRLFARGGQVQVTSCDVWEMAPSSAE
jgi:beta-fructofuranosidase